MPSPIDPPEVIEDRQVSDRQLEITFRTPALDHTTTVRVLLPDDFDPSGAVRYPVLYLLHGGGDDFRSWTDKGDAAAATAGLPLIVVMPDNHRYGNYVDWYNAGAGGSPRWETFIIGQLVPWVDANLPTVGTRDGRAVAGLSMGGGGAMGYASRHPDLFTAAAAFSGAVDTNTIPVQLLVETSGVEDGHAPGAVHGHRIDNEIRWRGHNPWDLAPNLDGLLLHLRTGNGLPGGPGGDIGDPVEAACHQMMTNLHQRLSAFGIEHVWDDYGAGGHNWWYWQRGLRQLLPDLMDRFAHPVPAPERVDFRAIEADFRVFGWDVSIKRSAVEFAHLTGAGPDGFELHGSGVATVTTASHFEPGASVTLDVVDADGQRELIAPADEEGRITVDIALGPANPHRQYTVEGRLWALTEHGGTWPVHTASVRVVSASAPVSGAVDVVAAPVVRDPAAASGRPSLPATGGSGPGATPAVLVALAVLVRLRSPSGTRA